MDLKRCVKCGIDKPRDGFYRQNQMSDGLLSKCRECIKEAVRLRRATTPSVREYDRERSRLPHRVANATRVTMAWRQKHPGRGAAQQTLLRAVRSGQIVKPSRCQLCGLQKAHIEGHHVDYSHPLAVLWVCKPCHAIADKVRRMTESMETTWRKRSSARCG